MSLHAPLDNQIRHVVLHDVSPHVFHILARIHTIKREGGDTTMAVGLGFRAPVKVTLTIPIIFVGTCEMRTCFCARVITAIQSAHDGRSVAPPWATMLVVVV